MEERLAAGCPAQRKRLPRPVRGVGPLVDRTAGLCLVPARQRRVSEASSVRDQLFQRGQTVAATGPVVGAGALWGPGLDRIRVPEALEADPQTRPQRTPTLPTTWENLCTHWLEVLPT